MICDVEVGGFGIVVYRAFDSTMLCEAHNIKDTVFDRCYPPGSTCGLNLGLFYTIPSGLIRISINKNPMSVIIPIRSL